MTNKINSSLIFGGFVGVVLVITSFVFYSMHQNITYNPGLVRTTNWLLFFGILYGNFTVYDANRPKLFRFKQSYFLCMKIVCSAAIVYSLYIYAIYKLDVELIPTHIKTIEAVFKEVYANNPLIDQVVELMKNNLSAGVIAIADFFNKVAYGALISLLVGFLGSKRSQIQKLGF